MAATRSRAPRATHRITSLVPSWVYRWTCRLRLTRGEAYLFYLLRGVHHNSVVGDLVYNATRRPTVESFRRITAHLASQCNDSPRVMAEVVGEQLVLILKAQGALYRIDQTFEGVAVGDLRHLKVGARFRISLNDDKVYRMVENGPEVVMYMRDGLHDAILRAYPKEEGPVNVYIQP